MLCLLCLPGLLCLLRHRMLALPLHLCLCLWLWLWLCQLLHTHPRALPVLRTVPGCALLSLAALPRLLLLPPLLLPRYRALIPPL